MLGFIDTFERILAVDNSGRVAQYHLQLYYSTTCQERRCAMILGFQRLWAMNNSGPEAWCSFPGIRAASRSKYSSGSIGGPFACHILST